MWQDVTDRNGAIEMFISTKNNLVKVQNMLDGYSGEKFANAIRQILLCSVEVIKKSDLPTFKVMPKRWIVERTAWKKSPTLEELRTQTVNFQANDCSCIAHTYFEKILDTF